MFGYILSTSLLLPVAPPTGEYKQCLFLNKPNKSDEAVAYENTASGLAKLGEDIKASKTTRTMSLVSRGQVTALEVAEGLIAGKIGVYQFWDSSKSDTPTWKLKVAYHDDIEQKNTQYAKNKKKGGKKTATKRTKKTSVKSRKSFS
jgi:hypothetical protein